jgi:hypothetical protein
MIKIKIKENSWLAALAAKKMGTCRVALVIGKTIHLHNTTLPDFIENKRWLAHELKHIDQYAQYGTIRFLWLYLKESMLKGYHQNKYEVEARGAETDESLLKKYDISGNVG